MGTIPRKSSENGCPGPPQQEALAAAGRDPAGGRPSRGTTPFLTIRLDRRR